MAVAIETRRMLVGMMLANGLAGAMEMGAVEMFAKDAMPART